VYKQYKITNKQIYGSRI